MQKSESVSLLFGCLLGWLLGCLLAWLVGCLFVWESSSWLGIFQLAVKAKGCFFSGKKHMSNEKNPGWLGYIRGLYYLVM